MKQKASSRKKRLLAIAAISVALPFAAGSLSFAASSDWSGFYQKGLAEQDQNPQAAVKDFRQALSLVKKQSKKSDDITNCKLKLAHALTLIDRADEARKILQGMKRNSAVLMELGSIEESAGNHQGAMTFYNQALSDSEKNYGPYSPQAAYSLHGIGRVHNKMGNTTEATTNFKRAITILSKSPNKEADEQLKAIMHNYGDLIKGEDQSDKDLLKDFQNDVLKDSSPKEKSQTPANGSWWQAQVDKQLTDSRKAESTLNESVAERAMRMPTSDATLAPAYRVVNETIFAQNRYGLGESQYKRMIATDIDSLGPNHPSVANDLNGLAQLYISQQKFSEAKPLLERALSVYNGAYGSGNVLTINTKASLASIESRLNNYDTAARLYREALSNAQESLGPNSLETAKILNGMGYLNYQSGKYDTARSYYEWAIASTTRAAGGNSPLLAACMKDYAQVLRKLDKPSDADQVEAKANRILSGLAQN